MGNVPAKCRACDHTFFAGIQITNARGISLSGNKQTCPRCGRWADIVEGTFDVSGDNYKQTAGAPVDPKLFTKLGLILVQAKLDKLRPDEIIEKVAPHSPALARRLNAVADDPQAFATVIAAIIAAIAGVVAAMVATSGEEPPKSEINIILQRPQSDLEKTRDTLHRFQSAGYTAPSWLSEYIEPKEG